MNIVEKIWLLKILDVVVLAIVNNQKSRLILVNMEVLHWRLEILFILYFVFFIILGKIQNDINITVLEKKRIEKLLKSNNFQLYCQLIVLNGP